MEQFEKNPDASVDLEKFNQLADSHKKRYYKEKAELQQHSPLVAASSYADSVEVPLLSLSHKDSL
tara:strand:- start:6314 stop:6508 length:195 start_codon:yes stop_codon:yes gene_type:complete